MYTHCLCLLDYIFALSRSASLTKYEITGVE